jgi:hypothetical protein
MVSPAAPEWSCVLAVSLVVSASDCLSGFLSAFSSVAPQAERSNHDSTTDWDILEIVFMGRCSAGCFDSQTTIDHVQELDLG